MNATKEKSVIFARVSSREQSEEGFSLDSQEKNLKAFAERQNYKVEKIFAVPESAKNSEQRKSFQELMTYIRKHEINTILCEKVDRITRNFKDAVAIDDWLEEDEQRKVVFTKDNITLNKLSRSNEKLNWGVRLLFAKNYIDQLRENIRGGFLEKAEQGWYPNPRKRGYVSIRPEGSKKAVWVQDTSPESPLPFIKKACEYYANRDLSLKELCRVMAEEGWKQSNGKSIPKSTMALVIQDPFYCGWFEWNGKVYKNAKHKPIISVETHQLIKDKLARKNNPKYSKHFHLFKGMLRCDVCGGVKTSEIQKGHIYYHCSCYRDCPDRKFVREELIEEQITSTFKHLRIKNQRLFDWIVKALKESHGEEMEYHNSALNNLNTQYTKFQQRIDNLYLDKLDGRVSTEVFDRLSSQFRSEQEKVRAELEKHEKANVKYFELGVKVLEVAQHAEKIYQKGSVEEKRQLLGLVFSNLTMKGEFVRTELKNPFSIIAERVKSNTISRG